MNKYILGIDTTSEISSIALDDASLVWLGERNQSRDFLPKIEKLINSQKISVNDLAGVVVVNGPGSYTGIRIGVSVANTLGMVLGIPVKVIDGLRAQLQVASCKLQVTMGGEKEVASYKLQVTRGGKGNKYQVSRSKYQVDKRESNICSLISAGGTRVYGRKYQLIINNEQLKIKEVGGYFVGEVEEFVGDFDGADFFVGEVGEEVREKLQMTNDELREGRRKLKVESVKLKDDSCENMFFLDEKNNLGRAWGAVQLFDVLPSCKNNIAIPMYLREAVRKV